MKGYGQKRYLQKIITSLNRNDSTTNVVLNGFNIGDTNIALLAMALVHNTHLKTLHLDGNKISDRGAVILAYALKQNNTLEFVSLNDNFIRSSGAEAIAYVLHENNNLRTLRLANNSIGNHGARELRNMMKHNEFIRELFLEGNAISKNMACKFDDRCRIQHTMGSTECGTTAASSSAGSEFIPYTRYESYQSAEKDHHRRIEPHRQIEDEEKEGELIISKVEWADTFYMDNNDAKGELLDANSNWDNLASYMMTVQNKIDLREKEEEFDGTETICSDVLSVASSEPSEVSVAEGKRKKKWSILKKTKQINSIKRRW